MRVIVIDFVALLVSWRVIDRCRRLPVAADYDGAEQYDYSTTNEWLPVQDARRAANRIKSNHGWSL